MKDAQQADAPRPSWTAWLIGTGILMVIVGLIGGLAAKRSADIASFVASQPSRSLITSSAAPMRQQIALSFDPASANQVAPDYGVFWLGMVVVALGVITLIAGIIVVVAHRRAS